MTKKESCKYSALLHHGWDSPLICRYILATGKSRLKAVMDMTGAKNYRQIKPLMSCRYCNFYERREDGEID